MKLGRELAAARGHLLVGFDYSNEYACWKCGLKFSRGGLATGDIPVCAGPKPQRWKGYEVYRTTTKPERRRVG